MLTDEQNEELSNMDLEDKWELANTTDDIDILEYLGKDTGWQSVCTRVARNEHVPTWLLIEMANTCSNAGRVAITDNPNAPYSLLIRLLNDTDPHVRIAAQEQLDKRVYNKRCINIDKCTIKGILE